MFSLITQPCLRHEAVVLQAAENLGEVMANSLRTQTKLRVTMDKLDKQGSCDAQLDLI